jgi:hypothetical protein
LIDAFLQGGDLRVQVRGLLRGYRLLGLKLLRGLQPERVFSSQRLRTLRVELLAQFGECVLLLGFMRLVLLLCFGDSRLQFFGEFGSYRLLGLKLLRGLQPERVFSSQRLRTLRVELLAQFGEFHLPSLLALGELLHMRRGGLNVATLLAQ